MDYGLAGRKSGAAPPRAAGFKAESPLVGRENELRRIRSALSSAAGGQGRTIFLTGQPGIGKTRLAHEALALARERGFRTLEGHAYPLEASLAYGPLVDAFSPLLRSLDPARVRTLAGDLPSLGRLFEGLRLPRAQGAPAFPLEGLGDPALEKTRLFEAVLRLLERIAQEAPVAVFIDDVQWADLASLELLHYLARGLLDRHALLLASYRDEALDGVPALQTLVSSLEREGLSEEIVIPPLESDAVDKLVRRILGGEPPGDLRALLEARVGGTPLFVEALIAALVESRSLVCSNGVWVLDPAGTVSLPRSVRRLILDGLTRLAASDRRVLDLIAIMGEASPPVILRAASGLNEETLLEALRRLRVAGLVAEGFEGSEITYSITHPLIQEVIYANLSYMERWRHHTAVIEALESFSEGQPDDLSRASDRTLNRLARHYRGAGPKANPSRALSVLLAAGDRAFALYANEEAAQYYGAVLAMVREGYQTAPMGGAKEPLLPWLLERLGEVLERTGKNRIALGLWNEALAERERAGDAIVASRLHCRLAMAQWDQGHGDAANTHLAAGLTALAGLEPCQELADLYYARFQILSQLGDTAGAAETVADLVSVAERLGSPRAEAEANLAASTACVWGSDIDGARERALHALTVAEQAQELAVCCRAHVALTVVGVYMGDHPFIRYHAERGLATAEPLGLPYLEVVLRLRLAYANFLSGAWNESLRTRTEVVALARRVGHPRELAYALAQRAMILALQGDLSEAAACISEGRMIFDSATPSDRRVWSFLDMAETTLALERGQAEHALGIAKRFADPSILTLSGRGPGGGGLSQTYMPMGLILLAEAQVMAGEPESALETGRQIIGLGPSGAPYLSALASRAEGLARQALGGAKDAMLCLARAHEAFTALGMPFEAARCLSEPATLAAARPELAVRSAQQGLAVFQALGARRYAERARRLLVELGISPIAIGQPCLGGVSVSARELEVAQLVAEGLTTAEIARRLTLSPRTVDAHLNRLYTRLGIGSRTALARLIAEAGLLRLKAVN